MTSNFNSWYEPQNFTVAGRRWSFTYSETTANRSLVSNDGIVLKIPITDINKYRSPYLWLCAHQTSAKRGRKQSDLAEPNPTIFEIVPSKDQDEIVPSKDQDEIVPSTRQPGIIRCDDSLAGHTSERLQPATALYLRAACTELSNISANHNKATEIRPAKKRRPKGEGSGTFITSYASKGKYGKKYPQVSYQVKFGGKKRSVYLSNEKVDLIKSLDSANRPILEILAAIHSPQADLVAKEYQDYLASF
ncbi:MAG: hypothetical protein N5P05_004459 (plasmid) [Chroococcopsis gigantea SAG 12.99]|jgi:hypothetical protein|nr:hypothetical protein [Chlorogloea purpurea SAG 13.99]MDV3002804.1 hypothetical protein [Chroococcopsis gigantea SAG 12.99]